MKWMKKWGFLLLFLATGAGYLALVDHWQVYAEPMKYLQGWNVGQPEESGQNADGPEEDLGNPDEGNFPAQGETADHAGETNSGQRGEEEPEGDGLGDGQNGKDAEAGNFENGGPDGEGIGGETGQDEGALGDAGQNGAGEDGQGMGQDEESQGTKAPEYVSVEDDYFADAVFIGDSRTVGMFEYGGLEEISTFYASKGMTIYKLFDSAVAPSPEGKITVEEALQQNQFAKIYLMVGINEMGTGTVEGFLEKYQEAVNRLRELQPDAIIYLQGIMKVTSQRSAKGDYINNEGIDVRNEGIALLADEEKIFYLDVNPLICDETGGMDPEYTYDGVHLKGKHIQIWKDYLKTHAISP